MVGNRNIRQKKVHFIGIGGIGMSALARWFLALNHTQGPVKSRAQKGAQNYAISGSDMIPSRITRELQKEGVKVNFGHKKGYIKPDLAFVIHSQAVKPSNPELREASRLGLPVITYPEAVGVLTENHKTIAIAGAHGKSTTTALVGLVLRSAGLDPTVIIGTELKEFGNKNFRQGSGPLVLEADEFGRAFLNYSPTLAVVTNIDKEHLDTYKNLAGVKKTFLEFLSRTKNGGALILNKDSGPLFSMEARIKKIARQKNLRVIWYSLSSSSSTNIIPQLWYNISNKNKNRGKREIVRSLKEAVKIPGKHNVANALAAYAAARVLKISKNKTLSAISKYRGAWRRFEYRGLLKIVNCKLKIYDDYAHHPTEIKATLQAFREKFPKSKIVCVFQPHQTERLRLLFNDFVTAFAGADVLILIPAYRVAGRDKINRRFNSRTLAATIQKKYPSKPVFYLPSPRKIKSFLVTHVSCCVHRDSCVLVMMGAGDIVNYTDLLFD